MRLQATSKGTFDDRRMRPLEFPQYSKQAWDTFPYSETNRLPVIPKWGKAGLNFRLFER